MKVKKTVHLSLIIPLLVAMTAGIFGEESELPSELSFLAETKTPDILFLAGEITTIDSTGAALTILPFRFYWEEGNYALDVRNYSGSIALFVRGIADTVWIYDFYHNTKITSLRNQSLGMVTGIPFSPKDILPIFNLYIEGNMGNLDTVKVEGSRITAISKRGYVYVFDSETGLLVELREKSRKITFSEHLAKKGFKVPHMITINEGFLIPIASATAITIKEMDLNPGDENNLLLHKEPLNMERAFDLRSNN
ncbi:hypothetical protein GF359_02315 [candidate division WOR-3 bacterium]|uniref:DUF4292 domain-containing protein n=1 Tax=candidate division WOR-3 bacterium TaxID=2052148 RepID=A0A9D5K840_UNCW3|nr:hypothetical protein [candidate division WOR-3 bacterium]MBD3364028.1 hypothetical protein [candidate division WOR-3 bacterium]